MAVTPNAIITTQAVKNGFVAIVNATGAVSSTNACSTTPSNTVLLYTAGANGSVVKSIMVASDDTASRNIGFFISNDGGTTFYCIGTITIGALSGANATAANVDVLASSIILGFPVDASGRSVIELAATNRLYVGSYAAVTASKTIVVICQAEDF